MRLPYNQDMRAPVNPTMHPTVSHLDMRPPHNQRMGDNNANSGHQGTSFSSGTVNSSALLLRVLTGRVNKVREWMSMGLSFPVVYRVYGQLMMGINPSKSGNKKNTEKIFFNVEDKDSGQKICCFFQEIDRDLGTFKAKESVVVVGRGNMDGMMQVFSVETFQPDDVLPHLPRMENFAVRGLKLGLRESYSS